MCCLLARLNHRDGAVAVWKKNTMLPFKAANPFFSPSEKPPLYSFSHSLSPHLLCQELFAPVFSSGRMELRQEGDWKTGLKLGMTGSGTERGEFRLVEKWG